MEKNTIFQLEVSLFNHSEGSKFKIIEKRENNEITIKFLKDEQKFSLKKENLEKFKQNNIIN